MKKILHGIQLLLDSGLVVFGLAFLVMKVLDRCYPFIDFFDHAQWLQYLLGIFVVLSGVMHLLRRLGKQHELDL